MSSFENREINKFYGILNQELKAQQLIDEEGGNLEQLFTQYAVDLLAEAGETENVRVAYDEKALGTKSQHKINAYSVSDNYETVDLFITNYKGTDEISKIPPSQITTASKRIVNFFRKGIYKDYVNEIEESSPIFQFAYTLANSPDINENLVRINAIILTDGTYYGNFPPTQKISGYNIYFRVLDLNYLYNITEKSHIPIEINFKEEGFYIPCIQSLSENEAYKSYLAIMSGECLASIYERFGSRLLEQNVRSFLQFTGKINRGIRNTIKNEPHMFLAFNNGIAATADSIELEHDTKKNIQIISKVNNFQIVNGGQTTASIYHTWKKDKADISGIFVQVKLTVVKNKENFGQIVSRISEYANTQNRVTIADLSSNIPFHIELEKLSRNIYTPLTDKQNILTTWFYERARGQYRNARLKEGFTKARQKKFDLKYPRSQMFKKEELAKYINSYQEICKGNKILIGPHFVVRGSQKNYIQFITYNLVKKPDNIYFEDTIAKTILFRTAEKIYGIKPNSIGDLRYVTVPYTISLIGHLSGYQLNLYSIWKSQEISEALKTLLYNMMGEIEDFIKEKAPGSLYGEWAKKEDCWIAVKNYDFGFNPEPIKQDLIDPENPPKRAIVSDDDTIKQQIKEEINKIKSIPYQIWKKIENFGYETQLLNSYQCNAVFTIANRIRNNSFITESERKTALKVLDIIIDKAPEILFDADDIVEKGKNAVTEITIELINRMVKWDKKNKRLKDHHFRLMNDIVNGKKELTLRNKKYCLMNYNRLKRYGFK